MLSVKDNCDTWRWEKVLIAKQEHWFVNTCRCSLWRTVSRGKSKASAVRWPASEAAWAWTDIHCDHSITVVNGWHGMKQGSRIMMQGSRMTMIKWRYLVLAQAWQVGKLRISWDCTPQPLVLAVGCLHHLHIIAGISEWNSSTIVVQVNHNIVHYKIRITWSQRPWTIELMM